jgi:hypothetical protein
MKGLKAICKSKNYKKRLGIEEDCPRSYLLLEERANALKVERVVPTMAFKEWSDMAQKSVSIDESAVKDATLYLHDLGSIVWFDEDGLRDVVVLDPQWLTRVFSSTVSAKSPVSNGLLRHEFLPTMWKTFPPFLHPFMYSVLEKFEVVHRLEGNAITNAESNSQLLSDNLVIGGGIKLNENALYQGRSFVPSLLSEQLPPQAELDQAWPKVYVYSLPPFGTRVKQD